MKPKIDAQQEYFLPETLQRGNRQCSHWTNEFFLIFRMLRYRQKCQGRVLIYYADQFVELLSNRGPIKKVSVVFSYRVRAML